MTEGLIQNQFMQIKVTLIASDLRRIYRAINKVNNCVKRESRDLLGKKLVVINCHFGGKS